MNGKHTPGPWRLSRFQNFTGWAIKGPDGGPGCIAERWYDGDKYPERIYAGGVAEMHANAVLMRAAPELLEALEAIVDLVPLVSADDPRRDRPSVVAIREKVEKAREAIAEARGGVVSGLEWGDPAASLARLVKGGAKDPRDALEDVTRELVALIDEHGLRLPATPIRFRNGRVDEDATSSAEQMQDDAEQVVRRARFLLLALDEEEEETGECPWCKDGVIGRSSGMVNGVAWDEPIPCPKCSSPNRRDRCGTCLDERVVGLLPCPDCNPHGDNFNAEGEG